MLVLIGIAAVIFVVLMLLACLVGKFFKNRQTGKSITIGTAVFYGLICVAYFGFIAFVMSGNLNR